MKKLLFLILIKFLFAFSVLSQSSYPAVGSDEWKKLNLKEKIAICQIEQDELNLISTDKLIEKCLNYPFVLSIFYFDDFQKGFEQVRKDFNGLSELFKRNDAFRELYKKYTEIKADKVDKINKSIRQGRISLNIAILEIFITQPEILNQINANNKKVLLSAFLEKYNQMLIYNYKQTKGNELYSDFTIAVLLSSMARIIDGTEFRNKLRNHFGIKEYDKILNDLCVNFLNKNKFETIIQVTKQNILNK